MARPTPDGRDWITPSEIIRLQLEAIYRNHPNINREQMEALREDLIEGLRDAQLQNEFKVLRLCEQLFHAIESGVFGPTVIPNTVDVDGKPIPTPVGEIYRLFAELYSVDFLDLLDENANPLEEG